jgi:hypothetical protein
MQVCTGAVLAEQAPVGGADGQAASLHAQVPLGLPAAWHEQTVWGAYLHPPSAATFVGSQEEVPPGSSGQGSVASHSHRGPPFAGAQVHHCRASPVSQQFSPTWTSLQLPSWLRLLQS